jgi:hypothetical protein
MAVSQKSCRAAHSAGSLPLVGTVGVGVGRVALTKQEPFGGFWPKPSLSDDVPGPPEASVANRPAIWHSMLEAVLSALPKRMRV